MRFVLAALLLTGCIDEIDARWTLDHDHVIAARATPPRVRDGETTVLDALVAHEGRAPTVEGAMTAELANPPSDFDGRLVQDATGRWLLDVPFRLSRAGAEDSYPVDVVLTFRPSNNRAGIDPYRVKKTVWIGEPTQNPPAPMSIKVGDVEITDEVVVPRGEDVYLEVAASASQRVNWLTNVGSLYQDDHARAFVHVEGDDARSGELVVVLRDDVGGVTWRVFPMRVAP